MKLEELETNSSIMMRRLADALERIARDKYKAVAEYPSLHKDRSVLMQGELLEQIAGAIRSSLI